MHGVMVNIIWLFWQQFTGKNLKCKQLSVQEFQLITGKFMQLDSTSAWHIWGGKLRGPKWSKKIPPTLWHHQQPQPLIQGRMNPCFHVVYAKFWPCSWNQDFSDQVIVQFCWMNCSLTLWFWADKSGTQCGLVLLPIFFKGQRVVYSEILFYISWW